MYSAAAVKEDRGITRLAGAGFASLVALAVVLFFAPGASANPIADGSTTLKLNKDVAKLLKKNKVAVAPVGAASAANGGVTFPVIGGNLDPTTAAGKVKHSGGIKFSAGKSKVALKSLTIKSGDEITVTAKVGDNRVHVLTTDTANAEITRDGFGINIRRVGVKLSNASAKALNKTFKVKLFKKGIRLGRVVVKTQPSSVGLAAEGSTDLTLDPAAAAALTGLGVAVAPIGPASVTPAGDIAFPITGGRSDTSTFAGSISHSGGLSLTQGSTVVELTDFTINVDADPDLTAVLNGGDRVSILNLDLSGLTVDVDPLNITLGNVSAGLTAAAAGALSAAFGAPIPEGFPLGLATVNAVAK